MKKINLKCRLCGKKFQKEQKEYNRRVKLKRTLFFCGTRCANRSRRKKKEVHHKRCKLCMKQFSALPVKGRLREHCSASCASANSVTEHRRYMNKLGGIDKRSNLLPTQDVLLKRESWKYVLIKKHLDRNNEEYIFEYALGPYVYDLLLVNRRQIIEFDGEYHKTPNQRRVDVKKDLYAGQLGFSVVRCIVSKNSVIPVEVMTKKEIYYATTKSK